MKGGLFITCEGCEGAGKSTFLTNLAHALGREGHAVRRTREPGGTFLGERIRDIVLYDRQIDAMSPRAELLLFLASRAEHVEKIVKPGLALGQIVLCDRYIDSSIAYQAYGRHEKREEVRALCLQAVSLMPQYTFYLDVDFETARRRIEERQGTVLDKMEMEGAPFHERVRRGFLELASEDPKRIQVLDARKSRDLLCEEAMRFLQGKL